MFKFLAFFLFLLSSMSAIGAEENLNEPVLPQELQDALRHQQQQKAEPPEEIDQFYGEFIKMMVMLSIIIAFLLILLWFVKRMLSSRMEQLNESSMIKILERRNLTAKTAIYIIETRGRNFILAESQNGVTLLGEGKEKLIEEPS